MPTAGFTTLGCKVNQYETQKILENFEDAGFIIVPFDTPADVYVINTCSVTSSAESKSRYTIRRANRNNPGAKVVVTGCAAQMAINKGEEFVGADVLVPNPDKLDTLSELFQSFPEFRARCETERPAVFTRPEGRTRYTLKVQDGCSIKCSYCSIPYTRPGMVSRPFDALLNETSRMVDMGYREVILTGVLIGAYGPETGSGGPDFETMVDRLATESGISRIRISSIEMRQVTPRLVQLIKEGKVAPHLHIPLQSGDTGVLADMNRPYTQDDYLRLCDWLKREISGLSITTDIMVGFPTETKERFLSSAKVCHEVGFLKAHLFSFSPRFGTPADQWGDPISDAEKTERRLMLQEITQSTGEAHMRRHIGQTMRVLVETKNRRDGLIEGLTDNYLSVRFAGPQSAIRQFVTVRLDDVRGGMLYGEIASTESAPSDRLQPLRMAISSH